MHGSMYSTPVPKGNLNPNPGPNPNMVQLFDARQPKALYKTKAGEPADDDNASFKDP